MWLVTLRYFLNFVQAGRADDGEGVLLTVDDPCLQRRVNLVEIDRAGRRAERSEQVDPQRTGRGTDLEAAQIRVGADGAPARRDLSHAVLPHLGVNVEARGYDRLSNVVAERTVESAEGVVGTLEGEADALNRGHRNDGLEDATVEGEELHRSRTQLS